MILMTAQAYDLLAKHGCYVTEICDACGQGLGPVRYTRRGEPGVWCSRECRGDREQPAIHRGGRPRKHRTPEECRAAKTSQQREYRNVSVWKKPVSSLLKTKDLQARKVPLSHHPLALAVALFLMLGCAGNVFAQGSRFDSVADRVVQGLRAPIAGAVITVCTSAGTGTPCTPITPIYTDQALTQQITGSVVTADSNGNFGWWAPAGNYTYSITAARVTGKLFSLTLPANPSSLAGGGYQFADQFSGADASVKVNACIAQVIANGGGKCDASGLYGAQVISQEIDVGNHAQKPVTLILPQGATWTVTGITNGTSCALKLFSQSSIIGPGTGGSSAMVVAAGAVSNNMDSLLCTEAAPTGNGSYVRAEGFQLANYNGATVANGTLNVQATFDDSDFRDITVAAYGTVGANIHGLVCCGTAFHGLTVNGNGVAGSKPLVVNLNTVTAEVAFYDLSADFPGTGQNAISVSTINNGRAVRFFNTYISGSQTDNTTADVSVTSTGGPVDFFGITCNNSGTSTAYCVDVVSSANVSVHIYGMQQVAGGSPNCVNDHFLNVTVPCDASGNVAAYVLGASNFQQLSLGNKLLISQTAPTISSGFNAGTIGVSCNGPASCNVNIGVGTAGSTGVIGLPTSTAGWNCFASNQTRAGLVLQTANTTTSATLTNFGTTFAATNWTNSDNVIFSCFAR